VELTGDGGDKVPALTRTHRATTPMSDNWVRLAAGVPGVSLARSARQPHLGVVKGVDVNSWGLRLLVS
jgi:hypothetical protein